MTRSAVLTAACLVVLLAIPAVTPGPPAPAVAQAQSVETAPPAAHAGHDNAAAEPSPEAPSSSMHGPMKMHQEAAAEARLAALVATMNSATGEARVPAMAAVINELVEQHQAMHARMGAMPPSMPGGRGRMTPRDNPR